MFKIPINGDELVRLPSDNSAPMKSFFIFLHSIYSYLLVCDEKKTLFSLRSSKITENKKRKSYKYDMQGW